MIADCGLRIVNFGMTTQELKDRTFKFGIRIVRAVEALAKDDISRTLGRQLLRAGTSVGANYRAAVRARSHADFIAKLGIVEEECDETAYWMEVIAALKLLKKTRLERLRREVDELLASVVSSIKTARRPRRS